MTNNQKRVRIKRLYEYVFCGHVACCNCPFNKDGTCKKLPTNQEIIECIEKSNGGEDLSKEVILDKLMQTLRAKQSIYYRDRIVAFQITQSVFRFLTDSKQKVK